MFARGMHPINDSSDRRSMDRQPRKKAHPAKRHRAQEAQIQPQDQPIWVVVLCRNSVNDDDATVLMKKTTFHAHIQFVQQLMDAALARAQTDFPNERFASFVDVVVSAMAPPSARLARDQHLRLTQDLNPEECQSDDLIDDAHRGFENAHNPYFVILTRVGPAQPLQTLQALPNYLLGLVSPDTYEFEGLCYDLAQQREMLGRFAQDEEVIPFIRQHNDSTTFDPRFAPFTHALGDSKDRLTRESKFLENAGDIAMLETAGTGKSRAMMDVGRKYFMIYVKCDTLPRGVARSANAQEIAVTGDRLFPFTIDLVDECTAERDNDRFIERAQGYILADICARLYFMRWMLLHFPDTTPEQFLVAQLTGGRDVMWVFFEHLIHYPASTLRGLASLSSATPMPKNTSPPRWAVDEAQVAAHFFNTANRAHLNSSSTTQPRSLLSEYIRQLKRTVAAPQVMVAGTGLTIFGTTQQLHSQLAKIGGDDRVKFPILTETDVKHRLEQVLNLDGVDWDQVVNLRIVTGRCRWSARLVALIGELEGDCWQEVFRGHLAELPSKTEIVNRAINKLRTSVADKISADITSRLESVDIGEHHRKQDEELIQRMFVNCTPFHNQANGVKMLFSGNEVNTLLALGLGQFVQAEERLGDVPVNFDCMTAEALTKFAAKSGWTVADLVAKWMPDDERHNFVT